MNENTHPDNPESSGKPVTLTFVQSNAIPEDEMCGCSPVGYPRWLQCFASIKLFVPIISLQMILIAFYSSIFETSLTTIETRYQMSIAEFGLMTTMFTTGSLVSTVFVTHFGGRPTSRRPVWIAVGGIITSLGMFMHAMPQFIFSPYQPPSSTLLGLSELNTSGTPTGLCAPDVGTMQEDEGIICEEKDRQTLWENNVTFIIFLMAQLMVGIGFGPLQPVVLCYIDDSASTGTTALASGIFESVYGIGGLVGFPIAGGMLRLWVDFNRVDVSEISLTPDDYGWVGAWWLGFLIMSITYFLLSFVLFLFPNRLPMSRGKEDAGIKEVEESNGEKATDGKKLAQTSALAALKEWPRSVWRLLKNPIYRLSCLSYITENALFYSLFTFFPKYMQDQFSIDVFTSGNITGFALIPAWAVGALIGGVVVKVFGLKLRGLVMQGWIASAVSAGLVITLMLIGCNNQTTAGVTVGYHGTKLENVSLYAPCNSDCSCGSESAFIPHCGSDGITYFSPCHAGCTVANENETYTGCSCLELPSSESSTTPPMLTPGHCESDCSNIILFVLVASLWVFSTGLISSPRNIIIISSVEPADKTFALGLSRVLSLTLGSLPFPVLYGICIDSSCLVWQTLCGERGFCDVYDIEKFRLILFGLSSGILVLQTFVFFLLWLVARRRQPGPNYAEVTN